MSNYTKATNFATKDALTSGNPLKTLSGTELDDEFNAIQAASVTKANTASAQLTGIPVAPTAAADTSTTQLATTAFVTTEANLKADLASPTFTGVPAAPTAAADTSTTQLATTAFVTTEANLKADLAGAAFTGAITTTSTIDGVDIATRDGVLTTTTTTANAALPKAGGALTGPVTTTSTVDGVDIAARDAVLTSTTTTANAALPKAGGAMTGNITGLTALDVTGTVTADGLVVDNAASSTVASFNYSGGTDAFISVDGTGNPVYIGNKNGSFVVQTSGSGYSDKVTVDSLGSVGIGTSSPSATLDVNPATSTTKATARLLGNFGGGSSSFINQQGLSYYWNQSNGSTESTLVYGNSANSFLALGHHNGTSYAERMRISATGAVGIGSSSVTTGFKLEVTGDARFGDAVGDDAVELGWSAGGSTGYIQAYDRGASAFRSLNLNNAMTLDSSGNVGIGTASPANLLHLDAGTGTTAWARFENSTNSGLIGYDNSDAWLFYNGASESMRISSAGDVLVGTTSNSVYNDVSGTGIALNAGQIQVAGTGTPLYLNRQGSDGVIQELRKDGTTVGSIGTRASSVRVGTGDTGLLFLASGDTIIPEDIDGNTYRDAAIDLGNSAARFKDLHLSGGVYLGGTGAANKLDDYESGTWTPNVLQGGFTITISYAKYVKIGRQVNIVMFITTASGGDANELVIDGLPFNTPSNGYATGIADTGGNYPHLVRTQSASNQLKFKRASLNTWATGADLDAAHIILALTYQTDS